MARLTTHVLDTAHGCPGAGVRVALFRVGHGEAPVATATTNADGRTDGPLLEGAAFIQGVYELVFEVGAYFEGAGVTLHDPPFLDRVTGPVRVEITRSGGHAGFVHRVDGVRGFWAGERALDYLDALR